MDWFHTFDRDYLAYFEAHYPMPYRLEEAIKHALKGPGKRLRPRFVKESSQLTGLDPRAAELLAYAIESVHLFSLIHDDLPCLDNDDFRRGIATVHKAFDEPTALLAGDALLNFAYETFAELTGFAESGDFARALLFFTRMIGSEGMIGGQAREVELGQEDLSLECLIKIQEQKTGALFQAALLTPFLLKGVPETEPLFQAVKQYSAAFGFAYQIADDLEDEVQDQRNSKKNIVSFLGREAAIELARKQILESPVQAKFHASEYLLGKLKTDFQLL